MRRFFITALVTLIMIIGILGIMNPGFKQPYKVFGNMEGKLTHNYFIFSIYQQYDSDSTSDSGKYIIYKRYIAIALSFYEISPLRVKQE
jgi:hypothetical protein